jgi:hypothetical protein
MPILIDYYYYLGSMEQLAVNFAWTISTSLDPLSIPSLTLPTGLQSIKEELPVILGFQSLKNKGSGIWQV